MIPRVIKLRQFYATKRDRPRMSKFLFKSRILLFIHEDVYSSRDPKVGDESMSIYSSNKLFEFN